MRDLCGDFGVRGAGVEAMEAEDVDCDDVEMGDDGGLLELTDEGRRVEVGVAWDSPGDIDDDDNDDDDGGIGRE